MMPITPGAQIDELRRVLAESEQRRQAAEIRLADCERRLGTAHRTIAAQDRRLDWLMAKAAQLRHTAASTVPDDYARGLRGWLRLGDALRFFHVYGSGGAR